MVAIVAAATAGLDAGALLTVGAGEFTGGVAGISGLPTVVAAAVLISLAGAVAFWPAAGLDTAAAAGAWLTVGIAGSAAAWGDALAVRGDMAGAGICGSAGGGEGAGIEAGWPAPAPLPALTDAAPAVAALAAGVASAIRVGGTAANASVRGTAGLVAAGALLRIAAMPGVGLAAAGGGVAGAGELAG